MMIGDVANVLANLDEAGNEYKRVMDNLNAYMNTNHFDEDLKVKLRAYFQHCRSLFRNEYHHETLAKMSPALRGEVANHENGGWVVQVGRGGSPRRPTAASRPNGGRRERDMDAGDMSMPASIGPVAPRSE